MHHLLFYDVTADYLPRRGEFREDHLTLAKEYRDRGELILGGALAEPVDQAILLFRGPASMVEGFVRRDPYVINGLVERWRIRRWTTVVGEGAETPL